MHVREAVEYDMLLAIEIVQTLFVVVDVLENIYLVIIQTLYPSRIIWSYR